MNQSLVLDLTGDSSDDDSSVEVLLTFPSTSSSAVPLSSAAIYSGEVKCAGKISSDGKTTKKTVAPKRKAKPSVTKKQKVEESKASEFRLLDEKYPLSHLNPLHSTRCGKELIPKILAFFERSTTSFTAYNQRTYSCNFEVHFKHTEILDDFEKLGDLKNGYVTSCLLIFFVFTFSNTFHLFRKSVDYRFFKFWKVKNIIFTVLFFVALGKRYSTIQPFREIFGCHAAR